jgi:hypothetical protein
MSLLPVLAKETAVTVTAGAITPVTVAAELVGHGAALGERLAERAGVLLREIGVTAQALQQVLLAVADAVEDGFLDELRAGLRDVAIAVELISVVNDKLDQAMPVLDATAPTLKLMNSTLTQLNGTIAQVEALPGVRMARRFVARPGASAPELV